MRDKDLIQQINTFSGGMNKDVSLENIPTNSYIDANDITAVPTEENEIVRIKALRECRILDNPESLSYPTTQVFRVVFDTSVSGLLHKFTFVNLEVFSTFNFTIASTEPTELLRFNDLIAQFDASIPGTTVGVNSDFPSRTVAFDFETSTQEYSGTLQIGGGNIQDLVLLQEKFSVTGTPFYDIVGAKSIGDDMFLLINISGTGMIAVAKNNEATGLWTTTRLLQSKSLNFSRDRVYKIQLEINNDYINMYWVDGTLPKIFSIKKQSTWIEDSALKYTVNSFITENTDAIYTYSSVETLTNLQIFNNTSYVSDIVVNDTGGVFINGNKQFAIRYKTGGGYTNFSVLSSPISIVVRNSGDYIGGGGIPNTVTTKSITLTLSNIDSQSFQYFQIGVIQYSGGAASAYTLGDFPVLGSQFTVTLTGNENPQVIDLSIFNEISPVIEKAHLNELVENRYYLGRIEVASNPDLAAWSASLFDPSNISIISESSAGPLDAVGDSNSPNADREYLDYYNTYKRTGYMYGDLYRFGIRYYLKNGLITPTYFGADIKIENDIQGNLGNLTNEDATQIYNYVPRIDTINFLTAPDIDGEPFLSKVEAFEIMRAPIIPDIIDTGYYMPTDFWHVEGGIRYIKTLGGLYSFGGSFSFAADPYPSPVTTFTDALKYGEFISQNTSIGNRKPIQKGYTIKCFGNPSNYNVISNYSNDPAIRRYDLVENTGFFQDASDDLTIDIVNFAEFGSLTYMDSDGTNKNTIDQTFNPLSIYIANMGRSYGIKTTDDVGNFAAQYVQIRRGLGDDRYGLETQTNYISTGEFQFINNDYIYNNFEIYGGDTYTQKCYQRIAYDGYWDDGVVPTPEVPASCAVSYYAQNRINAQAEYSEQPDVYPLTTSNIPVWIQENREAQESRLYDAGFTYSNSIRTSPSYNDNIPQITKQDNTLYYSETKLEGDLSDPYRYIKFANSKTYEMSDGILTGLYRIRGDLAVIQERSFRLQPVSPNALINPNDIGDLILGTGSVIGTKDRPMVTFGAQKKTHSLYYQAKSGSEYVVIYDNYKKIILRYGPDGVKNISLENFVTNFLLNNTRYIQEEFNFNIVYNPYMDEVWFMANNPQGDIYDAEIGYVLGDIVKNYPTDPTLSPTITYDFYNQFEARASSTGETPDLAGSNFNLWKVNRNTNFTLIFNEKNNSFCTNYTLRPRIAAIYNNTMLSVFPFINNEDNSRGSQLVEHDAAQEAEYIIPLIKQTPYIEMSVSPQANIFKRLIKMWVNIEEGIPDRVIIESDDNTAANITAFTEIRGRTEFNIPKDFYGTGQRVGGNKLRVKLFFDYAKKIHNFVSTVRLKDRKFNN